MVSNTNINASYFHSDEVDTAMHCGANKFTCREGGCLSQTEVCDGTPDCSHTTDGFSSDERNCGQLVASEHLFCHFLNSEYQDLKL